MRTITPDELMRGYDYTVVCETGGARGDIMKSVAFKSMNGAQAKAVALKLRSGLEYEVVRIAHADGCPAPGEGS